MQVFRMMDLPDKVIAFDSLPERFLKGFELCRADGFPRHWKEWMGKIDFDIKIPPEKDFLTGQVRYFEPIKERDSFFYLVDPNINQSNDNWKEICEFVKRVVPPEVKLREKIEDMMLPLAQNKTDSVTLEPEEVVVIPIPIEFQEKGEKKIIEEKPKGDWLKCSEPGCSAEFEGSYRKNALRMHVNKKHKKVEVA